MKLAHAQCTEEDRLHLLLYQLSHNPASDLGAAENFIMDPVEAEQIVGSLSEIIERAKERENGEQARRQTRNDSLRSRRQQESAEQMKQWRQDRNASLR